MNSFGLLRPGLLSQQNGTPTKHPPRCFTCERSVDGESPIRCFHRLLRRSPNSSPRRIFGTSRHAKARTAFSSSWIKRDGMPGGGVAWLSAEIAPNRMRSSQGVRIRKLLPSAPKSVARRFGMASVVLAQSNCQIRAEADVTPTSFFYFATRKPDTNRGDRTKLELF